MTDPTSPEPSPDPTDERPPEETVLTGAIEDRVYMKADNVVDALAERLRAALSQSGDDAQGFALCAFVRPLGVRAASDPSGPILARLVLPDGAAKRLGDNLETHLTVSGGRIRLWLAGLERISPGSTVMLATCDAKGAIAEASAVVESKATPIHLSIPWNEQAPPEAIALRFDL